MNIARRFKDSRQALLGMIVVAPLIATAIADPAPTSTEPMGQSFAREKAPGVLRVALVGSGSSHDFPKFFLGSDAKTLMAAGEMDVAATPNLKEALAFMADADVLVFSGNHNQWGSEEFQSALHRFADSGKGIVLLHAATWSHPWKGYNDRFVGGRTAGHGKGEFEVTVKDAKHPVTDKVPETFRIFDENYRFKFAEEAKYDLLAVNAADQSDGPLPSVWIVKDPKTRIVCITLGHDDKAHDNAAYKTLLTNAVVWAGGS
jgi:type 1 glutamine amidotransferase